MPMFAPRAFLAAATLAFAGCLPPPTAAPARPDDRPNLVLIVTDDQGFGDVGFRGNPALKTPNLDRLAASGLVMDRFYASPVCAPTRASLLTGRYNFRTRVVDTYRGRALIDPAEVTLAERLAHAGYRCGLFGKWHLGDNAPMRPNDQGYHQSLIHRGGGIGQDSDPPGGSSYYDTVLFRDGTPEKTSGYCSDVFTDSAIRFIESNRDRPFFAHLAFNAPHVPLDIRDDVDRWIAIVREQRAALGVADDPHAIETAARVYAMIANIDRNVGRLLDRLDALGLSDSTLVVFLSDNGPQQPRWNAGLRGLKGSVHEGGLRVPFVARFPGRIPPGRSTAVPGAHIDLVPTVLDAIGLDPGPTPALDGRSLWPLWTGAVETLPERLFVTQWHRGDVPRKGRACAVVGDRWKLSQAEGVAEGPPFTPRWELHDLPADPAESHDVSADHPDVVAELRRVYDAWFDDVTAGGFDPPRIAVGSDAEEPVILTRQDRRGPASPPDPTRDGWHLEITRAGTYRISVVRDAPPKTLLPAARAFLRVGGREFDAPLDAEAASVTFDDLPLDPGPLRLDALIATDAGTSPARYVRLERLDAPGSRRP